MKFIECIHVMIIYMIDVYKVDWMYDDDDDDDDC